MKNAIVLHLLVTVNIVPILLIPSNLMMEAIHYSKTSGFTSTTWCHIPEDGILQKIQVLKYWKSEKHVKIWFRVSFAHAPNIIM
jgi:hypothetical protein